MAWYSRRQANIVASATVVNLSDSRQITRLAAAQRRWQQDAWDFYGQLAEIHYPTNFIGSSISRFKFDVGEIPSDDPLADPVVPEAKKRSDIYKSAEDAMFQLEGESGGANMLARSHAMNMTVAAEGWLCGTDTPDGTNWEFLSVREVVPVAMTSTGRAGFLRHYYGLGIEPEPFNPHYIRRFWKAHPANTGIADSSLAALSGDCNRLIALNESITSRLLSRLSQAGVLFIPNTIQVAGAVQAPTGDGQPVNDPFFQKLLNTMEKAIQDRSGAAGAIPIIVRGPDGAGEHIVHITLDRAIDRVEMDLRAELRHNIATGLDLPPEISTGLSATNHWTSWSVMDSSFRSHLVPLADNFAEGVTRTYLWPALRDDNMWEERDIRRMVIVPDGANVVHRPNESEDGRQLYDRSAIGGTALRRRSGVPEEDMPEEDEYVRQLGMKVNIPYLATWGLKVHDKIDWANIPGAATAGAPGVGSTPPSKRKADSSDPAGAPGEGVAGRDPKDAKDDKEQNPNFNPGYAALNRFVDEIVAKDAVTEDDIRDALPVLLAPDN